MGGYSFFTTLILWALDLSTGDLGRWCSATLAVKTADHHKPSLLRYPRVSTSLAILRLLAAGSWGSSPIWPRWTRRVVRRVGRKSGSSAVSSQSPLRGPGSIWLCSLLILFCIALGTLFSIVPSSRSLTSREPSRSAWKDLLNATATRRADKLLLSSFLGLGSPIPHMGPTGL